MCMCRMKAWFTVFIGTIMTAFMFLYTKAQRAEQRAVVAEQRVVVAQQGATVNAAHANALTLQVDELGDELAEKDETIRCELRNLTEVDIQKLTDADKNWFCKLFAQHDVCLPVALQEYADKDGCEHRAQPQNDSP